MSWADPVAAFRDLAAGRPRMFWLDGGGSREWTRNRSLIGWLQDDDVSLTYDAATREVTRHVGEATEVVGDDIFTVLEQEMARDGGDPSISWVGYFGYACRPDLPARKGSGVPDAMWMRAPQHLVFEHPSSGSPAKAPAVASYPGDWVEPDEYAGWFDQVQEQLRLGNSYEVNLTYRQNIASEVDPVTAYLRLRASNPAPYAGYLQHDGIHVLSSSPERYATVDRAGWVETKPIKGTTPRGATPDEDEAYRISLADDPRYRAENLMIVDLLRNDLSAVCEPGTVTVPELMQVETYASVHQLVSTVRGHLRPGVGTVAALRALFPAGSMTGAPKLRTMEIIEHVETSPRGVYSGALGWISGDGRADLGVVIRTLVGKRSGPSDWVYQLGTGGGITVRSEVRSEYDETRWKADRVLGVLGSD